MDLRRMINDIVRDAHYLDTLWTGREYTVKHPGHDDQSVHGRRGGGESKYPKPKKGVVTYERGNGSTTLYRATKNPSDADEVPEGTNWTENQEDGEAYQDNPGYGGDHLVAIHINPEETLDLRGSHYTQDDWEGLRDATGYEGSVREFRYHVAEINDGEADSPEDAIDHPSIRKQLAENGFQWVQYYDTFPEGSSTWVKLGNDKPSGL